MSAIVLIGQASWRIMEGMKAIGLGLCLVINLSACMSALPTTGLEGKVLRGPIQPVCQIGQPCDDAPFSADFLVQQNNSIVATFKSAEDGSFQVRLKPGNYTVVPGNDAPLMQPSLQAKPVEVGPVGLTKVELHFDTGIR